MANDDKIRDSRQDYSKLINHQSLIKQIDEWERNSIEKIQHTAQECREELLKYMTNNIWNIEKKFNELKHIQRENQSNEMNFEYLKKRFDVMTKEFDCPSIISIREENSQDFIKKISIEFCVENKSNKWKENGKIIAGQNGQGEGLNQLNNPQGICIDKNKNIFIADTWNHRILQRKSNENQWKIIAGGNGQGDDTDQLDKPTDVIFDEQNNSLIIADTGNKRVIQLCLDQSQGMSRFIPWWNENQEEILIEDINCWGLAMDKFGFLYVSDFINNEVRKWKIGEEKGQLVAGGNGQGNQLNQLNSSYLYLC
ncbi:hypothetical protein I4U23_022197 [Adineta vaga]|nr:hypothetical protein I4U23_022197 [Adineta vaga]